MSESSHPAPEPAGIAAPSPVPELTALHATVDRLVLPLAVPGVESARRAAAELAAQLTDYVLPRLRALEAPLLAVVGGSTGAGKSSLVNALVGSVVSPAGAIRPTTRAPVLVHHPADAAWFADVRVLPGLPRLHGGDGTAAGGLLLVPDPAVGPGLALLDAPDVDSVVEANRRLAGELLAAADLWLFVTTAHRYADAVPWDLLRAAAARDAAVAVVLDRVPDEVLDEVRPHLRRMLDDGGLAGAPLLTVPETPPRDGLLPAWAVAEVRDWLAALAGDAAARAAVVRRTLGGAVGAAADRADALAAAATAQVSARDRLRAALVEPYAAAARNVVAASADGSVLRGEVLARWQEFIGTGELMRTLQGRIGALRDRVSAYVLGRPQPAAPVREAIEHGVAALVISEAEDAARGAVVALRADPAGRELVADLDPAVLPRAFAVDVAREVRAWQEALLDLVRTEGQGKRTAARTLAFGVNAVGVALMVVAFASTGGLTGAEFGIAGGTAVVAQKLLEALFGDEAVRRLARRAQEDLAERCERLLASERDRLTGLVTGVAVDDGAPARLRGLATAVRSGAAALTRGAAG